MEAYPVLYRCRRSDCVAIYERNEGDICTFLLISTKINYTIRQRSIGYQIIHNW